MGRSIRLCEGWQVKTLLVIFTLSCGADASLTHVAINQGAREFVLPSQNRWAIDGMIAGEAVAGDVVLSKLHQHHPKTALIIGWTLVGLRGYAIAHNVRQLR